MAMFTSGGGSPAPTPNPRPSGKEREPGLSIIASGMRISGELDTNGVVKVEGAVSGRIRAEGQVLVATGGLVEGDIMTREAIIGGEVRGAIFADERVEVQSSCSINGDITTQRIVVQEGGEVNGKIRMSNPEALKDGFLDAKRRSIPTAELATPALEPASQPQVV